MLSLPCPSLVPAPGSLTPTGLLWGALGCTHFCPCFERSVEPPHTPPHSSARLYMCFPRLKRLTNFYTFAAEVWLP
jgi:hypothetical protein